MISVEQQVGRYKIVSALGAGGMGEVFLAQDTELDRLVAVKILPSELSAVSERVHRFIQEAKAVSALNHPNILTIYEVGLENGTRFIVSEYIKGETLREKLKKEYFKVPSALDYALQIASALESAHSRNIIHRDIKPENIMIREDNLVKVLDFGLAKLSDTANQDFFTSQTPTREHIKTKSGMIIGTFSYMSPEQARGKPVDFRTDVFSFGVVLYEMLTGVQPFSGETGSDMIAAILKTEPENPSLINPEIQPELESLVLKTLSKTPRDRFQTFGEIVRELKNLKLQMDFRRQNFNSVNHVRTFPDAKTEILDVDTNRISQAVTGENSGKPSSANFLSKVTSKIHAPAKYYYVFYAIPLVLLAALLTYLFFAGNSSQPASAAAKLYEDGVEALREGTYFKASKLFEEALKLDENFPKAHASLAEAWMEMDYFSRAQNELLKVNELEKSKAGLLPSFRQNDDALYLEAVNALALRDFPKAVKAYQNIIENHPNSAIAYLDLGRAYEKNNQTDAALANFQKAAELDSQSGAAFLRMGVAQRRTADYDGAKRSFDSAEQLFDRQSNDEAIAEVRLQRGISLSFQEKANDARALFEQVVNMPRANAYQKIRALIQISDTCAGEGKSECAEQYAASAVKMAKDERMENVATDGLIDLGNAFLARADYPNAEQNFRQALDFAREDGGLRNEARARLALASLRIQQKNPDEAESFTKQAIPFFQNGNYKRELAQANLILGRAFQMNADYSNALAAFEQVENSAEAAPADRAYAKMVAGNVLLETEKFPEAFVKFKQSFETYKLVNSPFYTTYVLFYLAETAVSLGRFEEAQNYLQQADDLLKTGNSLLPSLETKKHLTNSEIALRKQNFTEAIKEAKLVDVSKGGEEAFAVDLILCRAQTSSNGKNASGLQNCLNAVRYAEGINNQTTVHFAKLHLAKAYLDTGVYQKAFETALAIKDYFADRNMKGSLWKAWMIAALACEQTGDKAKSREFAVQSLEVLNQLKADWGEENFNIYLSIPENNIFFKRVDNLARS